MPGNNSKLMNFSPLPVAFILICGLRRFGPSLARQSLQIITYINLLTDKRQIFLVCFFSFFFLLLPNTYDRTTLQWLLFVKFHHRCCYWQEADEQLSFSCTNKSNSHVCRLFFFLWESPLLPEGFGVAEARDIAETNPLHKSGATCQKFIVQNFDFSRARLFAPLSLARQRAEPLAASPPQRSGRSSKVQGKAGSESSPNSKVKLKERSRNRLENVLAGLQKPRRCFQSILVTSALRRLPFCIYSRISCEPCAQGLVFAFDSPRCEMPPVKHRSE